MNSPATIAISLFGGKYPFRAHVLDTSVEHSIDLQRYDTRLRLVQPNLCWSIVVCSVGVPTIVGTFPLPIYRMGSAGTLVPCVISSAKASMV